MCVGGDSLLGCVMISPRPRGCQFHVFSRPFPAGAAFLQNPLWEVSFFMQDLYFFRTGPKEIQSIDKITSFFIRVRLLVLGSHVGNDTASYC
jgi:hypothetical protein